MSLLVYFRIEYTCGSNTCVFVVEPYYLVEGVNLKCLLPHKVEIPISGLELRRNYYRNPAEVFSTLIVRSIEDHSVNVEL